MYMYVYVYVYVCVCVCVFCTLFIIAHSAVCAATMLLAPRICVQPSDKDLAVHKERRCSSPFPCNLSFPIGGGSLKQNR